MPYSNEEISEIIQEFMQAVGTRQYIGSRYVPIFGRRGEDSIIWDNTGTYEPLTIVLYQGNSYTSRQFVPVGVDILNEEFWANTGNYNAQVEQYRQTVLTYDGRITANADAIAAEVTARESAITQVSADIAAEVTARESAITQVSEDIAAETSARESAITQVSADIAAEVTARESAITQVSEDIAAEVSARESADTDLGDRIDAEVTARTDADSGIMNVIGSGFTADNTVADVIAGLSANAILGELGGYIAPTYIGDFMSNTQFGSCCKFNDRIYAFSPDNYNNTGTVRIFNQSTNALETTRTVQMGHGNSCCHDTVRNCFWIAPFSYYNAGVTTPLAALYKFDENFTSYEEISVPEPMLFVTFDSVTDTVYCGRFDASNTCYVYRLQSDESTFTLFRTISGSQFTYPSDGTVWQDACVNDNIIYMVKPEGTMYLASLISENPTIEYTYKIGGLDSDAYWYFGEVQGIEFGDDGLIYNARNGQNSITMSGAHHPINDGFVTVFNTKTRNMPDTTYTHTMYGTWDITTAAQNRFKLNRAELRSLSQVFWLNAPCPCVRIPSGNTITDPYRVRFCEGLSIALFVVGNYTVPQIQLDGGNFNLFVDTTGRITFNDNTLSPLYVNDGRAETITIRNRGTMTFGNTIFIRLGYSPSIVGIAQSASPTSIRVQDTTLSSFPALCLGGVKVYGG